MLREGKGLDYGAVMDLWDSADASMAPQLPLERRDECGNNHMHFCKLEQ